VTKENDWRLWAQELGRSKYTKRLGWGVERKDVGRVTGRRTKIISGRYNLLPRKKGREGRKLVVKVKSKGEKRHWGGRSFAGEW